MLTMGELPANGNGTSRARRQRPDAPRSPIAAAAVADTPARRPLWRDTAPERRTFYSWALSTVGTGSAYSSSRCPS